MEMRTHGGRVLQLAVDLHAEVELEGATSAAEAMDRAREFMQSGRLSVPDASM